MFNPNDAIVMARQIPSGSPECMIAMLICQMRGIDPWAMPAFGGMGLPNWQSVIAEQLMLASLRDLMMQRG
jgi:hypothetical protein